VTGAEQQLPRIRIAVGPGCGRSRPAGACSWPGTSRSPPRSRLLGYLPLSRLGGGEDVAKGVALEWARWGRDPRYVLSWAEGRPDARFAAIACSLRSLAIAADRFYAPRRAVEALLAMYPNARSELAVVTPEGAGTRAIGHLGFFKGVHRARLWPEALGWLLGALDPSRGRGGPAPWPGPGAPAALDRGGKPA
jgi:hypothetical protein